MGNCGSTDANVSIHELCRTGDVNGVRNLLKDNTVDVNGRDQRREPFNTPLLDATTTNNLEVVRLLLKDSRVDPNLRNEDGNTALHVAVKGDLVLSYEIAVLLVEDSRTSIHVRDNHNKKPFDYLETSKNQERFEKFLTEKSIDIEASTPKEEMQKIESSHHAPVVEEHKHHDTHVETHDVGALHDAAKKGDVNAVRKLLEKDSIDINGHDSRAVPGNTPLIDAVENDNLEVVRLLLSDDRLDPNTENEDGNTALHLAVQGELQLDLEIAELLLADSRIDVTVKDKHGRTALDYVKGSANEHKLEAYLKEKGLIQTVVEAVAEAIAEESA